MDSIVHPSSTKLFLVEGNGRGLAAGDWASLDDSNFELIGMFGQGRGTGHARGAGADDHNAPLFVL